jgi:hypothetical protein
MRFIQSSGRLYAVNPLGGDFQTTAGFDVIVAAAAGKHSSDNGNVGRHAFTVCRLGFTLGRADTPHERSGWWPL